MFCSCPLLVVFSFSVYVSVWQESFKEKSSDFITIWLRKTRNESVCQCAQTQAQISLYTTIRASHWSSRKDAVHVSVLTCYNLQVEQTGALADRVAGGTLVESWGAGADVSQCDGPLHLVWKTHTETHANKHTHTHTHTHTQDHTVIKVALSHKHLQHVKAHKHTAWGITWIIHWKSHSQNV